MTGDSGDSGDSGDKLVCRRRKTGPWLLALLLTSCGNVQEPHPCDTDEVDPNTNIKLDSFESGPVSKAALEHLRTAACVNVVIEPETPQPSIQFVIDVSGTMSLTPPDGLETKWNITREALRDTVEQLPASANLGVVYFPNTETYPNCLDSEVECEPGPPLNIEACIDTDGALPLEQWGGVGSAQRLAFEDALLRANASGGTPTHDAMLFGLEELRGESADGQRIIVLLTDGQPTYLKGCRGLGKSAGPVDPTPIIETIAEASGEGIATFVVGAPGSEETTGDGKDARYWLSEAAVAGMTAPEDCETTDSGFCHFDLTEGNNFARALESALERIISQSKSCEFPLPESPTEQPIDHDEINVLLIYDDGDGLIVGKTEGNCEEGYVLLESDEGEVIQLCPDTCAAYRDDLDVELELILGCESAPILPPT